MIADYRTYRAVEKKKQDLLDGKVVKIGKNLYHINSTFLKTIQGFRVYEVMRGDKHWAYLYYRKFDHSVTGLVDHWELSDKIN